MKAERRRVFFDIEQWRRRQVVELPQLMDYLAERSITEDDIDDIEQVTLWLPSDFDSESIQVHALQIAASLELELRKGEAYDSLREVRASVSHIAALSAQRRHNSGGVYNNTRAVKIIQTATKQRDNMAEEYNYTQRAIKRLDSTLEAEFQVLQEGDLVAKALYHGSALGTGKSRDSWIWKIGMAENEGSSEWQDTGELLYSDTSTLSNALR